MFGERGHRGKASKDSAATGWGIVKGLDDLIGGIAGAAGLKGIRDVGEFFTQSRRRASGDGPETPAGEAFKYLVEAIGSEILEIGQLTISGMRRTTGSDRPENGERFGDGWSAFSDVGGTLGTTAPNTGWGGAGSDAYADQNTRQRLRSETMADADRVVYTVLAREAWQIDYHREKLDGQSNFLGDLSYVTFPLQFVPRYGEAAKAAIELTAVSAALQLCAVELYQLHSEVSQNAAELQQVVGRYSAVGDGAQLADVDFDPPPPPPGSGWPRLTPIERSKRKPGPTRRHRPDSRSARRQRRIRNRFGRPSDVGHHRQGGIRRQRRRARAHSHRNGCRSRPAGSPVTIRLDADRPPVRSPRRHRR